MDRDEVTGEAQLRRGYESVKAEIRARRVAVFGEWAADDELWARATGQRFPDVPPAGLVYDADEA